MTCRMGASDQSLVSRSKNADSGICMFHTSLPSYADKTSASAPRDAKPLFLSKQLQTKAGKLPKSDDFSSKRPRSDHGQVYNSRVLFGDFSALTGYSNSSPKDSTFSERTPGSARKHSLDGKRSDKRHSKQPTKGKLDPFFSKGSPNSSSSNGGGSILGIYGLKSDTHDVTKHIEELSLNELLDGSYKYPSISQDQGKKATGTNENLVHTIKAACSILKLQKSVQPQNVSELDSSSTKVVVSGILSSDSSVASGTDSVKGDNVIENSIQSNKETCTETTTSLFCEPKDILERLSLPQTKNLDAFLAETTSKPAMSRSMMNDFRLSKPMPNGASLPPFPWSHYSNGSSKVGMDTGKLYSNRSKWVRIGSLVNNSDGDDTPNFDLTSLNFDNGNSEKGSDASLTKCSSSYDWQLKLGLCVENQPNRGPKTNPEHSPRLLAGAQLLYEIARHSDEKLRWAKKPSQKSMKARKPRTSGKPDGPSSVPRFISGGFNDRSEIMEKKLRYSSPNNKKMDIRHMNHVGRGPVKWSVSTSSRSSPNGEGKLSHSKSDSVKLGYKRPFDRPCDSELRKVVSMDWGRGRSKNES